MSKKKKRIIVILVTILILAAAIAGGISFFFWYQKNNLKAEVYSVDSLSWGYWGDEMSSSGMLTNDFNQDVYLLDNQTIEEIFVEEGQEVRVGDQLMSYDMTLTNLQVEMQELEIENIKNKIILTTRELEKLKKETPIPENPVVPEPDPTPIPTPDPVVITPPQQDAATGAYNYLAGDVDVRLANSSPASDGTTPETAYVIKCMPGCYVEGSFFNQLALWETQVFVRLQVINPESGAEMPERSWDISSSMFGGMQLNDTDRWSVETRQIVVDYGEPVYEPEIPVVEEPVVEELQGYTAKELADAIAKAQKDLKDYDLQQRQAELKLDQMRKLTADGVVLATVDGTVKTVGDRDNPPTDGSAFISVTGSEGLYVTGYLSELQLADVQVGTVVYANSWESGRSFEATIQEISPYPSEDNNSWGEGNRNVSYYPYVAYISDAEGLRNGEYVDLTMTASYSDDESASAIYLPKAYVREEDGRSYVMMADGNDRLKKQYVETGKTIYGQAVEIRSGLLMSDRIAFPYGKTAKEGAKVEEASSMYR